MLTDSKIRKLAAGDRQVDLMDARLPDFGLRVHPGGTKSFFVRYRLAGRRVRLQIGRFPAWSVDEARARAEQVLRDVAHGRDPQGSSVGTFEELVGMYLAWAGANKRSWEADEWQIRKDLLPRWKALHPREITRAHVMEVLIHIRDERKAPTQANRRLALIRKLFNFALELDVVQQNPAAGVKRPSSEHVRDRILSADEIRAVWRVLEAEAYPVSRLFQLLLLAGQRSGETKAMRWDELEGDGWWTIPGAKTKSGRPQRVYLTPLARRIIRLDVQPLSEWVFPGQDLRRHLVALKNAAQRYRRRSGVDFAPHDLRRTFATGIAGLEVDPHVVGACLSHSTHSVTARHYDHYAYAKEKRAAWERWSARVAEICGLGAVDRSR